MLPESARLALEGSRFGDVRWFPEVRSTNEVVAALARGGASEGVVAVAGHQTAGRGRMGRRWHAPPGSSLLLSVLLRPSLPAAQTPLTTVAMALAAAEACEEVADVSPLVKWPNDLVVGEGKLAGILGERVSPTADGRPAVVVGIGVNANWGDQVPPDGGAALDELAGRPVALWDLLVALLHRLDRRYRYLSQPDVLPLLLDDYRARSATLGRRVRVEVPAGELEGEAVRLTAEGHLVVDDSGRHRVVSAGDVVHVRPA